MKRPFFCLALALGMHLPLVAGAQVSVSIHIAPPPLLVYAQPPVPGEGHIWVPGYWSWSDAELAYYWVPGTWVMAPHDGDLWTPGYWAFEDDGYVWYSGYWAASVGYYGGINYGYGYAGSGYEGGRWDQGSFGYNRTITNVDVRVVHNVYSAPATHARRSSRVSFNGGNGGAKAQPTPTERQFQFREHAAPLADQLAHEAAARGMPTQRAPGQAGHARQVGPEGGPPVAATPRPSEFASPRMEQVRTPKVVRPVPGTPVRRATPAAQIPAQVPAPAPAPTPAHRPAPRSAPRPAQMPQHTERQSAPQMHPDAPQRAPSGQRSQPEPQRPAGAQEQPQQHEGPNRKER